METFGGCVKTIEERKNVESFWELIRYNKLCITKDDWNNKEQWVYFLRNLVKDYDTLLDVGCHDCSITKDFKVPNKTGIDMFEKIGSIAEKYCTFKCMDMRDICKNFESKSFDVVCQLDTIEHLETIEEADKLMVDMEILAKKLVVHMCPANVVECENFHSDAYGLMEGYDYNNGREFNPLQHHLLQPTKDYYLEKGYGVRLYGGDLKKIIAWKYV